MPLYLVETPQTRRLIRATNRAVAVNHVVKDEIKAESITPDQLCDLLEQGLIVEKAGIATNEVEKEEAKESFIPPEPFTSETVDGKEKP